MSSARFLAAAAAGSAFLLGAVADAAAQTPNVRLRYTFQPDCYRASLGSICDTPKANRRLDFGPQVAVWLETADRSAFIADILVTNLTAVRGIGNRPGFWRFPSTWRFPYGKRKMALPVWAHARGRLYDTVIIQDDPRFAAMPRAPESGEGELGIGFHESVSSPDPYHCLSFMPSEWVYKAESVDAITCPTTVFNSSKGKLVSDEKSYYPPRSDVDATSDRDCDILWTSGGACPAHMKSVSRFAAINDLDAVAAATPAYGQPFTGIWHVPGDLPEGDYALVLEINKEFDNNASHAYPAYEDRRLPDAGFRNNFGQPSVVFRAPFRIDRTNRQQVAVSDIAGYGDWDGATGTLHAPDQTISDSPGSGSGRLLVIAQPSIGGDTPVHARLHLVTEIESSIPCEPQLAGGGEVTGLKVRPELLKATEVTIEFVEPDDAGERPVDRFQVKYRQGDTMTEQSFQEAVPAASPQPLNKPGSLRSFTITGLKPATRYVVGIRAHGRCIGGGRLAFVVFTTPAMEFKQLSGCFIATAAYGTALEPEVGVLRRVRNLARDRSTLAAAAVGAYERSSPPVAALLRESELGRAVVRSMLAPMVAALGGR